MNKIKLTQGKYALVDNKDYPILSMFKWYAHFNGTKFYAVRGPFKIKGKMVFIYMHRFIMDTPKGMETDHIDNNGLNNQRKNLRVCTSSQNKQNIIKNCPSGFKGVSWHKVGKKWQTKIKVNKKSIFIGLFTSKLKAYEAYCKMCSKYHGDFAKTK